MHSHSQEAIVDFNLIETVLFIIARHLNVLRRNVLIQIAKEPKINVKTTVAISEIKVHRRLRKKKKDTTTTTDSAAEKSQHQHERRRSRRQSRSRSKSKTRGRYSSDDDDYSKRRGHKRHGPDDYDEDKMTRGHKKHGRDDYDEDKMTRGPKKHGRDDYDEDKMTRGHKKHGRDDYKMTRGHKKQGRDDYNEDKMTRGRKKDGRDDYDEDKMTRGPRKHGRDEDTRGGGRAGTTDVHERILVVSRTSLDSYNERDQRSPVVTQEQYDNLLREIRRLQEKFGVVTNIGLHNSTSLTDPRAALNIATRLETSHKKLNEMLTVVTKFAGAIPGFDVEAALRQMQTKETPSSKVSKRSPRSSLTEPEETLVVTDDFSWDEQNLASWIEWNAETVELRKDVVGDMSKAATNATDTAERANKLFTMNAPKLSQASILNVQFARLRIFFDRFTNNATALDTKLSTQMGVCQDGVSQLQFEVDTMLERIEEALSHPAEDPAAIAAAKDEFGLFQAEITSAHHKQAYLKELQELSVLELESIVPEGRPQNKISTDLHQHKRLRRKVGMISQFKTTREEALDHLKEKASVTQINSLLSSDQLYAVVCFFQEAICNANEMIHSGERMWQRRIEDYISHIHSKGDRIQVATLHQSLRKYLSIVNTRVNTMRDIVGELPVTMYEKKMDRDGNCLSCGIPANVKLSKKNMELAKRLVKRRPKKPLAMEEEDTEKCYPGRPIPHPLDPSTLACGQYVGASISKSEVSLDSTIGVVDANPAHKSDTQNMVHLTCTPCNQSEEFCF